MILFAPWGGPNLEAAAPPTRGFWGAGAPKGAKQNICLKPPRSTKPGRHEGDTLEGGSGEIQGGELAGYLKAIWPDIFGSVFGLCSAKLGPTTSLERRPTAAHLAKEVPGGARYHTL